MLTDALIAPRTVMFYDKNWVRLGAKSTDTQSSVLLNDPISQITGIPKVVLRERALIFSHSIAQRFSWAARRATTRLEDASYCLLGLFDINMPLLYGESDKAFLRLQQEILGRFDDESIFAWRAFDEMPGTQRLHSSRGILARHPAEFSGAGQIVRSHLSFRPPYALTNRGIEIKIPAGRNSGAYRRISDPSTILLNLNCHQTDGEDLQFYMLSLRKLSTCQHYCRAGLLLPSPELTPEESGWEVLKQDEVVYAHWSWRDGIYCSSNTLRYNKGQDE